MLTIHVENVTDPAHRAVLNELLSDDFSYDVGGDQLEAQTFTLKFENKGAYAVVHDEILDIYHEDPLENDRYIDVYSQLPTVKDVEDKAELTVVFD